MIRRWRFPKPDVALGAEEVVVPLAHTEGGLTASVQRGEAVLGSARHRVLVYPFLKLSR